MKTIVVGAGIAGASAAFHLTELGVEVDIVDSEVKEVGEIRVLDKGGPRELFPYLDSRLAGIYLSGAARLSGESIRTALLGAATQAGARKLSGVAELERSGDSVVGVRLNGDLLPADSVIVAGGAWSANLCRPLGLELGLEPQRGQILHLKVEESTTGAWPVIVPVLNDYYLLAFRDSRVVVGATRETGSGFDCRVTAGGVEEVLREGLAIAPDLAKATLSEVRVGLRPMTKDGLPLIGRPARLHGLIVTTGMGRYGLTTGPYAGRLAAQLVTGKPTEIDLTPYKPDRQIR